MESKDWAQLLFSCPAILAYSSSSHNQPIAIASMVTSIRFDQGISA